ncbi:hypothetical protein ASG97_02620 [Bacillus sp. Soil745]|nr:hypothetical protein ASG97_02620 [Bacillus sp. Soil745]
MYINNLIRKQAREGILFKRILRTLEETKYFSKHELYEYQSLHLKKIINHAYENVPYYNKIFKSIKLVPDDIRNSDDLWKVPLLTKEDVKKNFKELKSIKSPNILLSTGRTSGTTGSPTKFYRDLYSINFENAVVWRQWNEAGINLKDKIVVCRGDRVVNEAIKKPPFWKVDNFGKKLMISSYHLSENHSMQILSAFEEFQPVALQAFPSSAYTIAKFLKKINKKIKLKAVFTSSETLYPFQRELIEEVFDTKVWDYYGMAERIVSASECIVHKGLHINEEYGITQFIDNQKDIIKEKGTIVGTNFHNYSMPLLRYVTTDYGELHKEICSCGKQHRLIYPIDGRKEDMIHTNDGRILSPANIMYPFKYLTNIAESQVIQHEIDSFQVLIVPEKNAVVNSIELKKSLEDILGVKSNISIELVDRIQRSGNGKFRRVISHLGGDKLNAKS